MPPQSPTLRRLHHILLLSSKRSNAFLAHLSRLLSTTQGIDASLCTLQYTLALVHASLVRWLSVKYEKLALSIFSKASEQMLPGESVVFESPHLKLVEWCAGVKAAQEGCDDFRTFMRLWGLVKLYNEAREIWLHPKRDPAIKLLTWARILASSSFQVLENGAYLVKKGVLQGQKWTERESKWWVWSSRLWMAETVLELLRLLRVRQLKFNEDFGAEKVDEDDKMVKAQSKDLEERWKRDLWSNVGWIVPSLHYSFANEEDSPFGEALVGAFGMIPGLTSLREAWRETAS